MRVRRGDLLPRCLWLLKDGFGGVMAAVVALVLGVVAVVTLVEGWLGWSSKWSLVVDVVGLDLVVVGLDGVVFSSGLGSTRRGDTALAERLSRLWVFMLGRSGGIFRRPSRG